MRQTHPGKRGPVALFAAILLILSAFSAGTVIATPIAGPSDPNTSACGAVSFTNVPGTWYLIVEPGDNLITSGFDNITLTPGNYTYDWRDSGNNDQGSGSFTVDTCATPTPTITLTPTATPTATATATSTATPATATVTFLKEVDNSAGGSAAPRDFQMTLSLTDNNTGNQSYTGYSGDTISVLPGTYSLTELSLPGYVSINGGGCYNTATQANTGPVVTIGYSENWVCGFTNTYVSSPSPTATPTATATKTPTATPTTRATATTSRVPSPSAMPDTSTGGGSSDDGSLPLILIGLVLLTGGLGYAATRRLKLLNRPS